MKYFSKFPYIFLSLFLLALVFYKDAYSHFFFQDDWWHFYISDAQSIKDFIAFFNPNNAFGYQIYRPLSTQVFFFTYQTLFGYSHTIFQTIVLFILSLNSYLVFQISQKTVKKLIAFLLAIFYLVHHQNIGIVYYLSTIQTSLAVLFILLALKTLTEGTKNWPKKLFAFYVAALLCHEIVLFSSFIFIAMIAVKNKAQIKKEKFLIAALLGFTLVVIVGRLSLTDKSFFEGVHYQVEISPKSIANNLMWYVLWLLSLPEYVINFVGSGLKPLPPLFGVYKAQSMASLFVLAIQAVITSLFFLINKNKKDLLFTGFYFVSALLPVLIFPWHKYTYYLPFATVFFIGGLVVCMKNSPTYLKLHQWLVTILIITATITNLIDRQTSSSYERGVLSQAIKEQVDFEKIEVGKQTIMIANDPTFEVFAKEWGSTSTQAKIVLRDNLFFTLQAGNPNIEAIYEDDLKENVEIKTDHTIVIKKEW